MAGTPGILALFLTWVRHSPSIPFSRGKMDPKFPLSSLNFSFWCFSCLEKQASTLSSAALQSWASVSLLGGGSLVALQASGFYSPLQVHKTEQHCLSPGKQASGCEVTGLGWGLELCHLDPLLWLKHSTEHSDLSSLELRDFPQWCILHG